MDIAFDSMAKQAAGPGECYICREPVTKRTAFTHIKKNHADPSGEERFAVMVDTPYSSPYWMLLLVKTNAKLSDLDESLRDIWVECCGHLSAFTIHGVEYHSSTEFGMDPFYDDVKSMNTKIKNLFIPGLSFIYEYDFGTTTKLRLKVSDTIMWKKESNTIVMTAMNKKPDFLCSECGKPAVYHYNECDEILLCEECSENEDVDECYLLPICNSPRTGLCGYEGGKYDE